MASRHRLRLPYRLCAAHSFHTQTPGLSSASSISVKHETLAEPWWCQCSYICIRHHPWTIHWMYVGLVRNATPLSVSTNNEPNVNLPRLRTVPYTYVLLILFFGARVVVGWRCGRKTAKHRPMQGFRRTPFFFLCSARMLFISGPLSGHRLFRSPNWFSPVFFFLLPFLHCRSFGPCFGIGCSFLPVHLIFFSCEGIITDGLDAIGHCPHSPMLFFTAEARTI